MCFHKIELLLKVEKCHLQANMFFDNIEKICKSLSLQTKKSTDKKEKIWIKPLASEDNNNYKYGDLNGKAVLKRDPRLWSTLEPRVRQIRKIFNSRILQFFIFIFLGHLIGEIYQEEAVAHLSATVSFNSPALIRKSTKLIGAQPLTH